MFLCLTSGLVGFKHHFNEIHLDLDNGSLIIREEKTDLQCHSNHIYVDHCHNCRDNHPIEHKNHHICHHNCHYKHNNHGQELCGFYGGAGYNCEHWDQAKKSSFFIFIVIIITVIPLTIIIITITIITTSDTPHLLVL